MRQVGQLCSRVISAKKVLVLGLCVLLQACGTDDSEADEIAASPPPVSIQERVNQTNLARSVGRFCGDNWFPAVGPVEWNELLEVAALRHSQDMHSNDFFAHDGSDGSSVGIRATDAGYPWAVVGENLSKFAVTFEDAMEGWIESPLHCEALMRPEFDELGTVRVGVYWTMVLGVQF